MQRSEGLGPSFGCGVVMIVRVAARPEDLLDDLVSRLSRPSVDPFAPEWVSVPSLGFRSWLQLELARRLGAAGHQDGIVANVEFPFPGSLRWTVLRAHSAAAGRVELDDPWQLDRLTWCVLEVLSDPPLELDERLGRSKLPEGVSLASRAAPIADLFDRYDVHRPSMLREWSAGHDVDSAGQPLAAERLWQPQLFRAVRAHIADRHGVADLPSERLSEALPLIRAGALQVNHLPGGALPQRLFVFGASMLPADVGPILHALAEHREVTAMLLSPSPRRSQGLSRDVAAEAAGGGLIGVGSTSWTFPRASVSAIAEEHPLLASWASRPLESAMLLGAGGVVPEILEFERAAEPSLLETVQMDLRRGRVTSNGWSGRTGDGSISIHAAPGPARQVEVLRDVIFGLLRDDPELTEGDIAVVCPRLESYVPVLGAVLGPSAERGEQPAPGSAPALRYTIVDRNARSLNPVLDAMATLLDVLPGRFDVGSVRELLHAPAVRERFDITTGDLSMLSEWIGQACIRWGLDGQHRTKWDLGAEHEANSWASGLDQIMMGVALGEDLRDAVLPGEPSDSVRPALHALAIGGVAPAIFDEAGIVAAGRVGAALRSLAEVYRLLMDSRHRPISEWRGSLRRAADLMVAPQRFEYWQRARFDDALDGLVSATNGPDGQPSDTPITFGDMRRLLAPALEGQRARADLGHGSVVIGAPSLLSGVPFKVICVLGLDADALPSGAASGDDLMQLVPNVGDRDARGEARAELLAAIGSARQNFVVTCTSSDVRTGKPVPASALLDELVELLADTMGVPADELRPEPDDQIEGGEPINEIDVRCGALWTHPRQAFAPANFTTTGGADPFGFDPTALEGARALAAVRPEAGVAHLLLDRPLADGFDSSAPIELGELQNFFAHPVKSFFRNRLDVTVPRTSEASEAQLPLTLEGLDASEVGAELLDVGLELLDLQEVRIHHQTGDTSREVKVVLDIFRARGLLPPDTAARLSLSEISNEVLEMLELAELHGVRRPAAESHAIDLELDSGVRIVGAVNGCVGGERPGPVRLSFHRPSPKNRTSLALDLLVLAATEPEVEWHGVYLPRGAEAKKPPEALVWTVVGETAAERRVVARRALESMVAQYLDGQRYPLPLFAKTSYAQAERAKGDKGASPEKLWGPSFRGSSSTESEDGYHVRAFGEITFAELMTLDAGGYRFVDEATRLWTAIDDAFQTPEPVDAEGEAR